MAKKARTTKKAAAAKSQDGNKRKPARRKPNGNKEIRVLDGKAQKRPGKPAKQAAKRNTKLHETLVRLVSRPQGATSQEVWQAGFHGPAIQALKIAERRGLKITTKKTPGERTRYIARGKR